MLGAIVGDFVGSVHEFRAPKSKDFPLIDPQCRITDDSILTFAVAEWVMHRSDLVTRFHELVAAYPAAGWGGLFHRWALTKDRQPYGSFGNGSAMRASPVGWAFTSVDDTLAAAADSARVTHDHPEGIKGAEATAVAIYLARTTGDKELIRGEIARRFDYDLDRTVDSIRPAYRFDVTCQGTVPEAIVAFLDSTDFEDAIRNAISLGGDADTLACITGGIAHAYYRSLPRDLSAQVLDNVPAALRHTWSEFREMYRVPAP